MFDELFTQPAKIEKYEAEPMAEHRKQYLRYRADSGASGFTLRKIASEQLHLIRLLDLKEGDRGYRLPCRSCGQGVVAPTTA